MVCTAWTGRRRRGAYNGLGVASGQTLAPVMGRTQIGSSRRPASFPLTPTPIPTVTDNAGAMVQPRELGKNTQLVEQRTQVRVLQAQLGVLQSSHCALSIELENLHREDCDGTIRGFSEELRTL